MRLILLALLGAGFVAIGLWSIGAFGGDHPTGLKAAIAGYLGVPFFGLCSLIALVRLRDDKPVIRVDAQGIWWKYWSEETIPWDAIDHLALLEIKHQKMIAVGLKEPKRWRSSRILARLAILNEGYCGYRLCLSTAGTNRSIGELRAVLDVLGKKVEPRPLRVPSIRIDPSPR